MCLLERQTLSFLPLLVCGIDANGTWEENKRAIQTDRGKAFLLVSLLRL